MSPVLGIGTAPVLGRVDRRRSFRALQAAYALGIRHIDTARSYGWGSAEGLVGAFLQDVDRRDVRLVTKCGIVPIKPSKWLSAVKAVTRMTMKVAPGLTGLARRAASAPTVQPCYTYDVTALELSLETSLLQLKTDAVDVLLLHSFAPQTEGLPEVLAWFRQMKRLRKIGDFGFCVDGDLNVGLEALDAAGGLDEAIVQAPVTDAMLALPIEWTRVRLIAHSPFKYLTREGETLGLEQIFASLGRNPRCEALVCSMFDPSHISANVQAWRSRLDPRLSLGSATT